MTSEKLNKAREYESQWLKYIDENDRPTFHLTGGVGWINDPNGFSVYRDEYHLFYQYHPYSTNWGPMHWGHAKTNDFVRWERLPIAIAPDEEYDKLGCFSGSAVELDDGRQLLMYTGVTKSGEENGISVDLQQQCIAFGDGINYTKYENNPVISSADLPKDSSILDFRDPKMWREDGKFYVVVGNMTADGSGAILLYESEDAIHWTYDGKVDSCHNQYGKMWECPDFFPLDGKQVLLVSPMEMTPIGLEFHAGHNTMALIGSFDQETKTFKRERVQAIDYGIDFYATQTLLAKDGRRIMIAWMQNWATQYCKNNDSRIFGQMILPREISVRENRLIQKPVREIEQYRKNHIHYENVFITDEATLQGINGRCIDLILKIKPVQHGSFKWFKVNVAKDGENCTSIRFKPGNNTIRLDRSKSGFTYDIVHMRDFMVRDRNGEVDLRIILDKNSLELFVNDGEQAATCVLYTRASADSISFVTDGEVLIDVEKYDLRLDEK